ncbi:MAG: hypothetical protein HYY13_06690 [Nitrospirae bacterium]|nr:hypothetical protein [Nitrospirota bacterium]
MRIQGLSRCRRTLPPLEVALYGALIVVSWPTLSLAYVDPTGGGLLVQILMGGLAGVIVVSRLWIRRLMGGLIRLFRST